MLCASFGISSSTAVQEESYWWESIGLSSGVTYQSLKTSWSLAPLILRDFYSPSSFKKLISHSRLGTCVTPTIQPDFSPAFCLPQNLEMECKITNLLTLMKLTLSQRWFWSQLLDAVVFGLICKVWLLPQWSTLYVFNICFCCSAMILTTTDREASWTSGGRGSKWVGNPKVRLHHLPGVHLQPHQLRSQRKHPLFGAAQNGTKWHVLCNDPHKL